jgi:hypothetical protein
VIRALLLAAFVLLASGPARAQALIADLPSHPIAITTGFAGTELLLFGATEGEGDVVVIVRGPDGETSVRRKARVAGIWINRDELRFSGVPTFYRIASSSARSAPKRPRCSAPAWCATRRRRSCTSPRSAA